MRNFMICGMIFLMLVAAESTYGQSPGGLNQDAAAQWIENNGVDPVRYLAQKFDEYDIVILGEEHRVRQFPEFVASCIPALYKKGVTVIALEFENSINQPLVDSFLALPWLDNELLYSLRRRTSNDNFVLFKEYNDIFRKCWSFNQLLPDSSSKMTIVALDLADEDSSVSITGGERAYARDKHMFEVLDREVIQQGKKVLVYCGWMHAMTRLVPPKVSKGVVLKTEHRIRLGNYIRDCCADEMFSVFFYAPYVYTPESTITSIEVIAPVSGQVEKVMERLGNKPVGFDIGPSPFGALTDDGAFFRFMKADWTLADVCDGYLFLAPISEWEVVSIEDIFCTDAVFDSLLVGTVAGWTRIEYLRMKVQDARNAIKRLETEAYDNLATAPE